MKTKSDFRLASARPRLRDQAGSSLLEALIAVSVIAFGALGVAGLNLMGLRSTQESAGRTAAAELSQEIGEKLRAHGFNDYANIRAAVAGSVSAIDTRVVLQNCFTAACTPAQQLNHELVSWAKSIENLALPASDSAKAARLPTGLGIVCLDDTPDDGIPTAPACTGNPAHNMVAKVWWLERQKNADDNIDGGLRRYATVIILGY